MKIDSIEIFRVAMPLVYPFRTAFGNDDTIESVLVRIMSDGIFGWGEASPWRLPAYSSEWAGGAFIAIRDFLAPTILGGEVSSGADLQGRLSGIKGNHFAKSALDLAWWDLHAKRRHEPLWKTLGGQSNVIDVGADFGVMESIDMLLETIAGAVQSGFKRIKLKYRPGWDLEMVATVRAAFPKTTFHIDCNSGYTLDSLSMFRKLDQYNLAMIEQPLAHDDLIDHAELQREISTPLCLDESITSVDKARKAIQIGACRWINIKPGRVGGLTNALAIHNLCEGSGIPCWVGGMLESAVGARHCAALATLPNFKYPADIFPSERFYKCDLAYPPMTLSMPSQMTLLSTPGVGAQPDPDELGRLNIEKAVLRVR